MNMLPAKANRARRSLCFCLIVLGLLSMGGARRAANQTKYAGGQDSWAATINLPAEITGLWFNEVFSFEPVIATGRVVSTSGEPLFGVKVIMDGATVAVTDTDGFYKINNITQRTKNAATFSAEGYVKNTRTLRPGESVYFPVILAPIANRVTFQAEQGGTFNFNRAVITIPPGSFIDGGGGTVTGPVNLEFTLLDVTEPMERDAAMGEYTGRLLDGSIKPLQSYGVFDWRVRGQKGEPLTVAPGRQIGFSIPIPQELVRNAPREMGIFTLDTISGIWVQTGWFGLQVDTLAYNGTVTVMDGFNLDILGPGTCITVKVVNLSSPSYVSGFDVTASGGGYVSKGVTDSSGRVCLIVKQGGTVFIHAHKGSWTDYPGPITITAPTTNSDESDCGDPIECPTFNITVDLVTGGWRTIVR